ncbi:TniQ family protein [Dechloromonas sp. ARDL1]|uniref:TniQ family protein n=1 Tax=Dechloromonas sp. ARDL1 TaxID=3322121 RepID=UPI003DA6FC27
MTNLNNPRSTLHALVPMGQGMADVESLSSYFCRLAHSHGMTARNLAAWTLDHYEQPVPDDFKWFRRSFAGMSMETEQWAAWLAELTGVANLDHLTLAPWRHLISNPSLTSVSDRWCPCCLSEDREREQFPYLRLTWDLAPVAACLRHKVELVSKCPHCGKSNVRNRASTVVIGYCTSCGGFLGNAKAAPATPQALWVARQVGLMLATLPRIASDGVATLLETIIERMAQGNVAAFAQQLGLSKSGVWHWVRKGGLPTLPAWLGIALHGRIGLERLFAGELSNWQLPTEPVQFSMSLSASPRKGIQSRKLIWEDLRQQLRAMLVEEAPISLADACLRTGLDHKLLYLRANTEARAIVDRYQRHQAASREAKEIRLQAQVGELIRERFDAGFEGMSAREVWQTLDSDLKTVRHTYRQVAKAIAANDPK